MKVLFVSAILPYPLYSGGQVRVFNLIKVLSRQHKITLAAYIRHRSEVNLLHNLDFLDDIRVFFRGYRLRPRYLAGFLFSGKSLLSASYQNPQMIDFIRESASKFDLIHIEPFYVFRSIPETAKPVVAAEHNIEYEVYSEYARLNQNPFLKPILNLEAQRLKNEETAVWKKASAVIAVSSQDAGKIRSVANRIPVTTVENGVDTEFFRFRELFPAGNLRLLFVGNFRWLPNLQAYDFLVKKLWPQIKKNIPDVNLVVVGQNLPNMKKVADRHIIYAENVKDVRDEYNQAHGLLAPMGISGGSKYKILEAMGSGTPVLTSPEGAAGLAVADGVHLRICRQAEDYLKSIKSLRSDICLWSDIAVNARKLVEQKYDWQVLAKKLDHVWRQAV